jgi:threonine dehydrogenase-like Zn-dependent dehydrogenase
LHRLLASFAQVLAIEPNSERGALARRLGASAVAHPSDLAKPGAPVIDVSIEVSGNARALQASLDSTAKGGRVVLGSWYGESAAQLRLGLAFHRSHLSLKCSQVVRPSPARCLRGARLSQAPDLAQVSQIPADLSGRWDKQRRFDEAWRWVRRIGPSRSLSTTVCPLREAQAAYEALDTGATVGAHFTY